jgi:hypothetical protein
MTKNISTCTVAFLLSLHLSVVAASAGDKLKCASGFKVSSNTLERLTCQRSSTVTDARRAEKLSRKWLASAACSGTIIDPQASIAEAGAEGFLVTVRFACESD